MPDPFKSDLRKFVTQPLPVERSSRLAPINGTGDTFLADGYSVRERADRSDPFARNLKGIAPPVTDDLPNVAWDEEK